jgi:hypothetical protein
MYVVDTLSLEDQRPFPQLLALIGALSWVCYDRFSFNSVRHSEINRRNNYAYRFLGLRPEYGQAH